MVKQRMQKSAQPCYLVSSLVKMLVRNIVVLLDNNSLYGHRLINLDWRSLNVNQFSRDKKKYSVTDEALDWC